MCAKKNIKSIILITSRSLFNEYSWAKVSLRKIASELNISDGNLRYHYKTKEEIVLELFTLMTEEMAVVFQNVNIDVSDLENQFKSIFKVMYSYRFLFIESYFIKKAYDSYQILFNQLEASRRLLFMEEFKSMKEEGVLSKSFSDAQYEILFEQVFIISDSWIKYLDATDEKYVNQKIDYYAKLCYGLFIPYISKK